MRLRGALAILCVVASLCACKKKRAKERSSGPAEVVSEGDRKTAVAAESNRKARADWFIALVKTSSCLWVTADVARADRAIEAFGSERNRDFRRARLQPKYSTESCRAMGRTGSTKVKALVVPLLQQTNVLAALAERIAAYLREKDYVDDDYKGLRAMREAWVRDRQLADELERQLRAILDAERDDIREGLKPDLEDGDRQAHTYLFVLLTLDAEALLSQKSIEPGELDSLIGRLDGARNSLRELGDRRPTVAILNTLSGTIGALKETRRALERPDEEQPPREIARHVDSFYDESRRLFRELGYLRR